MNIYIGNLPFDLTENELRKEFDPYGQVVSVTIVNDNFSGSYKTRVYGFVKMGSKSEAETALSMLKNKVIKGKTITVNEALPLSKTSSISGKRKSKYGQRYRSRL